MKSVICLCFAAGLAAGWWMPGEESLPSSADNVAHGEKPRRIDPGASLETARSAVRLTGDKVEIPRARLAELLYFPVAPVLSSGDFITREGIRRHASFENLAEWCGLDAAEKQRLADILREAADARKAWERQNVKVQPLRPGSWNLDYPGDEGKARADLKRRIGEAFSPEKAAAIELGGDLDNFFGLALISQEVKNGRVEVSAIRTTGNSSPDPDGGQLSLTFATEGRSVSVFVAVSEPSEWVCEKLQGLVLWDDLVAGATEAARK